MDKSIAESRLSLLKEGLDVLTSNSNALVYVDVGHSNWLAPSEVAKLLDIVSNDKVRGFSVNVSNLEALKKV